MQSVTIETRFEFGIGFPLKIPKYLKLWMTMHIFIPNYFVSNFPCLNHCPTVVFWTQWTLPIIKFGIRWRWFSAKPISTYGNDRITSSRNTKSWLWKIKNIGHITSRYITFFHAVLFWFIILPLSSSLLKSYAGRWP